MQSESIKSLASALCKAQGEIRSAPMNSVNPFFKSKYADLGSVIEAARAALKLNGLSFVQIVKNGADYSIGVETILMHESGEWISGEIFLPVSEGKNSLAQAAGSVITYIRRYSLAAMLGIYADEDEDGNDKQKPTRDKANVQTTTPRPEAPTVLRYENLEEVSEKAIQSYMAYVEAHSGKAPANVQNLRNWYKAQNEPQDIVDPRTGDGQNPHGDGYGEG